MIKGVLQSESKWQFRSIRKNVEYEMVKVWVNIKLFFFFLVSFMSIWDKICILWYILWYLLLYRANRYNTHENGFKGGKLKYILLQASYIL